MKDPRPRSPQHRIARLILILILGTIVLLFCIGPILRYVDKLNELSQ